jgi:hypothetical protein
VKRWVSQALNPSYERWKPVIERAGLVGVKLD